MKRWVDIGHRFAMIFSNRHLSRYLTASRPQNFSANALTRTIRLSLLVDALPLEVPSRLALWFWYIAHSAQRAGYFVPIRLN